MNAISSRLTPWGTLIRRDYTERRRAELALRESETLLSQFMENLPIGVIVVDAQWRPRFANNAAVDILGPTILIDDGSCRSCGQERTRTTTAAHAGTNGWDMLAALKEDPELASIPVVIVSNIAQESRATLLGAIALLEKPLDRSTLFAVLERNLGARRSRVLIADDSRDARSLLEELVAPVASEVRSAANGQEALTLLREFEPDVVLLDLLMPVMNGLTFLEVLRSAPRFQNVPVIVISAKDLTREERERVERHTAAILRKGNALESDLKRALGAVFDNTERTDEA